MAPTRVFSEDNRVGALIIDFYKQIVIIGPMLKIRLQRTGRRNKPFFRVVLTDSRNSTKSGNFKAILGTYEPVTGNINLKKEEIKEWIGNGAKPSDTVHNMLIDAGIMEGKKINVLPQKSPIKKEEEAPKEAPKPASPETGGEATPAEASSEEGGETTAPAEEAPVAEEPKQEEAPAEPARPQDEGAGGEPKAEEAPVEEKTESPDAEATEDKEVKE